MKIIPKSAKESISQTFTYSPPAEEQLKAKLDALADIVELADQIKDAEVFRRHAKRIASAASVMALQSTISWKSPLPTTKVQAPMPPVKPPKK